MSDTLVITSESTTEFMESTRAAARDFDQTRNAGPDVYSFADIHDLFRVFSPKRVELIEALIQEPAESLTALAARLGRNTSEVSQDVTLLADRDIVTKTTTGRTTRITCPYDAVELRVTFPRN